MREALIEKIIQREMAEVSPCHDYKICYFYRLEYRWELNRKSCTSIVLPTFYFMKDNVQLRLSCTFVIDFNNS